MEIKQKDINRIYAKLDRFKTYKKRIMIATKNGNDVTRDKLQTKLDGFNQLVDCFSKRKAIYGYILKAYYYQNKTIQEIADTLNFVYDYVIKLKRKIVITIIEEELDKKYL